MAITIYTYICIYIYIYRYIHIYIYIHVQPALVRYQMQSDASLFGPMAESVWQVPAAAAGGRTGPDQTGNMKASESARKSSRKSRYSKITGHGSRHHRSPATSRAWAALVWNRLMSWLGPHMIC